MVWTASARYILIFYFSLLYICVFGISKLLGMIDKKSNLSFRQKTTLKSNTKGWTKLHPVLDSLPGGVIFVLLQKFFLLTEHHSPTK